MNIDSLVETIKESMNSFRENELAYLSMTGKNELLIRDRIAYELYSKYSNYIISREYNPSGVKSRIDLAILENGKIKDIIELKSVYTFDSADMRNYINAINKDFNKNSELVIDGVNQYEIIIATHIKEVPNEEFKDCVKYYRLIKKYLNNIEYSNILVEDLDYIIKKEFSEEKYEIRKFKVTAGQSFGVNVDVWFWILKNNK